MFGDKNNIYGQFNLSIDEKNRIFLPPSTNREIGEELVLSYDKDLEIFKIFTLEKFDEILENLSFKIEDARTKDEEIYYKKKYLEFAKSILRCSKVDTHGRILIGNIFKPDKKVLAIGFKDHLALQRYNTEKKK